MFHSATRVQLYPGLKSMMTTGVQNRVDDAVYFVTTKVHVPSDARKSLKLGRWTEILSDEMKEAGVEPSTCSTLHDEGLFCKTLVPDAECGAEMRLAVLDFGDFTPTMLMNYVGKCIRFRFELKISCKNWMSNIYI